MKLFLAIFIAHLLSLSAFGAIRRDAIIYNASGVEVEVFYVSGELNQKIKPGESKQLVYPPASETLLLKFETKHYRFPCQTPPTGLTKAGMFKSTFKLVVANDLRLYLIPFETPWEDALTVAKKNHQPDGWPIEGVEVVGASTK